MPARPEARLDALKPLQSAAPRFGNANMVPLSPLTRLFAFFETSYEPGFNLLSKILSNVIPRTAITRNWTERQEVLFNEVTQGATLFALLPVTSWIGQHVQGWLSGVPASLIRMKNEDALLKTAGVAEGALKNAMAREAKALAEKFPEQKPNEEKIFYETLDKLTDTARRLDLQKLKVAKLGKSLGAGAFIATALVATTYWRNYRTIKRTGFSDYKQVVGLGGQREPTEADRRKTEQALEKNRRIIIGLLSGGAAAWLGIMGVAGMIARRGAGIFGAQGLLNPQRLNTLMRHWAFVGKRSNQIKGPFRPNFGTQTMMIWGIPSYLGWFLGCRDKYEVVEQTSKFATFWAGYLLTPRWVRSYMARKGQLVADTYSSLVKNVNGQKLIDGTKQAYKQKQWMTLMGANVLVAGALPLLFNIPFSKWRHQRETSARLKTSVPAFSSHRLILSGQRLERKPGFREWGAYRLRQH